MGLFDNLFKKEEKPTAEDNRIVAVCTGEFISPEKISDPVFAESKMGKTVAIEPTEGKICAPCNGILEVVFPTGHAFALRSEDGTGILVHIGVDTVNMRGDGFKTLKKQGEAVKAGETVVEIDLNKVKAAGHPATTMIIISEPAGDREYNYIEFGPVTKGQTISK